MSAFVVPAVHVDLMVGLARRGPRGPRGARGRWHGPRWQEHEGGAFDRAAERVDAQALGVLLVAENVASVSYRDPRDRLDQLPGPVPPYWLVSDDGDGGYLYREHQLMPTAIEGIKLLNCYRYQSCEHPGWSASEAARFCDALARTLIPYLPGYDDAPWEWSSPPALPRRPTGLGGTVDVDRPGS